MCFELSANSVLFELDYSSRQAVEAICCSEIYRIHKEAPSEVLQLGGHNVSTTTKADVSEGKGDLTTQRKMALNGKEVGKSAMGLTNGRGHPRLRGGSPADRHNFTPRQMKGLSVICGTLVASLPVEAMGLSNGDAAHETGDKDLAKSRLDDVDKFYRLTGSDPEFAERVGGHVSGMLKPPALKAMGFLLGMLTTRLGTLLVFGRLSLSWKFPFMQSFLTFSPELRERALLSWADSSVWVFQVIFKLLKVYILFCFYAQVDANGESPCWKAMGYSLPDPEERSSESTKRPLEGHVIDLEKCEEESLQSLLTKRGFTLLDDISHLRTKARENRSSKKSREIGIKCDVVVVGSGSGGGVIAGVLAKAGYKVLVLEKGQYYARDDLTLLEGPSLKAMYEGAGTLSSDDVHISLLAGSTVGGGSTVNWAASLKTPKHVRDEWAQQHGLSLFASEKYERAIDAVWQRGGVQANCKKENFQNEILTRGCSTLGYEVGELDRNVGQCEHQCGWCNLGCRFGEKQATSETWLVDAVNSGGAVILSNCFVREILSEDNNGKKKRTAIGVIATECGESMTLYVEAAITVACGGSLNTPPLLQKSGLTNANIGRNLRLHPVIMGWGYFSPGPDKVGGLSYDGAIMTSVSREVANWDSSGYGALLEVPITHPATFAALMPWRSGSGHKQMMRKYSRTSHFIVLARDTGSGKVRADRSGFRLPHIVYDVNAHDEGNMMEGLEKGLRALAAAGAEEVGTHHADAETFSFSNSSENSAKFEAFLKRTKERGIGKGILFPICSAHQMGSCRMGVDEAISVVDEKAETWEVEGLFIGDASVFPTASGVNPMITVQSIAYCTAQNILDRLQSR